MASGLIPAIFDVFTSIGSWITSALFDLQDVFYVVNDTGTGEFTFLGVLAICGLGFAVVFLLIGLIQRFLHFRG